VTALKLVSVALLGAGGTGKKSLAVALTHALAATPSKPSTPARWQVTADAALQRLLSSDGPELDTASKAFQAALAELCRFDHRLLLGLDLPLSARPLLPQNAAARSRTDTRLRAALTQAGLPFQVIYGTGDERLKQALMALGALKSATNEPVTTATSSPRKPWVWACDKCSDAVCEHKLLSDLLLKR
jgi:nicotinamide riboside kinase